MIKNLISWAVKNSPAMNVMLLATLIVGSISLMVMRREVFPEFELEIVLVSVPYPGASAEEVEEGICQKVEEAVASIAGIRKQTSVAKQSAGFLVLELEPSVRDVQKLLNEVRSEIDQIPSFPELAEDPEVQQITFRAPAIQVGIIGPPANTLESEIHLRELAEEVRNELLQQPPAASENPLIRMVNFFPRESGGITSAVITAARGYQIDVEISEESLKRYGLSLQQIAQIIRQENLEMPGGNLRTSGQELVIRGNNKSIEGAGIERIQLMALPNGDIMTVGDVAKVNDSFVDSVAFNEINGRPGMVITVERTSNEDLLNVVNTVKNYVQSKEMPAGYSLTTWADQSIDVRDRLNMLIRNGTGGLILVFIVLAVFLELRLAFWVALGIPVSILGAGTILLWGDQTLNMLTMFAFLLALGIVVDDAIVIGENIYAHREMGKSPIRAAIDGTYEVLPSVTASVMTTIVAFCPLLFVSGVMGKFIAVMPLAVIGMLFISLLESTFVLPVHLSHDNNLFFRSLSWLLSPLSFTLKGFNWLNKRAVLLMETMVNRYYGPSISWCLSNKATVIAGLNAAVLVMVGMFLSGLVPFEFFPKMDARTIEASAIYPDGTPARYTDTATQRMQQAIYEINQEQLDAGKPGIIEAVHRCVGSVRNPQAVGPGGNTDGGHAGSVRVALVPIESGRLPSEQILAQWREKVGPVVGAETVKFVSESMGPGGTPIEFKLLAKRQDIDQLKAAVEDCKAKLATYDGVFDIEDDNQPGKWELQIKLTEAGRSLGVTLEEVVRTARAAFYGEEVMRLQRGRHEVKLMVRYPQENRRSMDDFNRLRIRGTDGIERPITELAEFTFNRGPSEINRIDQMRSITVLADVDRTKANSFSIVQELRSNFVPDLLEKYPGIFIRWEGQQQQTVESFASMFIGFGIATIVMYILLTLEFRSYLQPLIVLVIIPFGIIGAVFGHFVLNLEFTIFSMFGLIALTGVVVNDSIVLLDFINRMIKEGHSIRKSIVLAGQRRFRPVVLTSLTTMAGLIPMLLETSFQAQVLIPMATSLCFGVLFATVLVLVLVPVAFEIYAYIVNLNNVRQKGDQYTADRVQPPNVVPEIETAIGV